MQNSYARTRASLSLTLMLVLGATACSGGSDSGGVSPTDSGRPSSPDTATPGSGGAGGRVAVGGAGGAAVPGAGSGAGGQVAISGSGGAAVPGTGGSSSHPADAGTPAPDAGPGGTPAAGSTLHFVVYGDTRGDVAAHQSVVDAYAKLDPQVVVHSGDLWDGYTPAQFDAILTKNANIGALLAQNLFLVSRGNHENAADLLAFKPTLVRNNTELYSATVGPVFFVSLGMDPAGEATFLEQQLSSPAAKAATWRFVFSHYPIYSGGPHGGHGIAAIESLCDKYGVAIYFNGHDHLYERSHQMHGQQIVDRGNSLTAANGTVYIVTGGGGAGLYSGQAIPSTHFQKTAYHFVEVTATATGLTVNARTPDGQTIDSFTIAR